MSWQRKTTDRQLDLSRSFNFFLEGFPISVSSMPGAGKYLLIRSYNRLANTALLILQTSPV